MPNDPRHSRFVAVKGHTCTLVIDTHADQPETMTSVTENYASTQPSEEYASWYSRVNSKFTDLTGGYDLTDIGGIYDSYQLQEAFERGEKPSDVVAEIRSEVARIFDLAK